MKTTHVFRGLLGLSLCALLLSGSPVRAADALNPGDLDPSFQIGGGGNSPIISMDINKTNGVIYIGGRFSRYNTNDVRRFAVLNPNGSLDLTWWNKIKNFNQPGANDNVNVVRLDNQGRVLVGGRFGTFFGRVIRNLVRLNPDGTLDETFNNGSISGFGPNDEVTSIYVTSDDKVLIAGQFTSYNDGNQTLTRNQMVRLNSDMSIDTTFDPGVGAQTTSGSPIGTIVQQPDGRILIGGEFTTFQNTAVGRITRLNNNGTLDTTFNPGGAGLATGNIREIELLSDGRILAVGNIVSYNGTATDHFIRLSSTGALDTGFSPNVSAQIRSVEVQSDGKYMIVGDFRTVGSANSARPAAARINTDGTPDLTFDGGVGTARTPESPGTLDIVYEAKLDDNEFLVMVGDFTHWNTIENVNRITRIATANVTVNNAPTITTQPSSLPAACVGQSASFTVVASGDSLTYQWKKDGVDIAGATAATYTIASVTAGDAGSYTVVVSNTGGSVTSAAATLTPDNPPTITSQPQSTAVNTGSGFTLSVTATGTAPLTYQWSLNGAAIGGATASTYTVASAQAGNAGSYTVTVTNPCGPTTSSTATVTVNAPNQPPAIVNNPSPTPLTVCAGTNVTYSVGASGTTPLSYQWFLNGVAINGATSSTLTLNSVTTANAGSITVQVSNAFGNATSSAVSLTVLNPPSIATQPQSTTVSQGNTLNLSVAASGSAPFTYQWLKNGAAISGATASTFTIASVSSGDAGTYSVQVANACGSVTSAGATVTVSTAQPPNIVGHPLPQSVKQGSSAFFNVVTLGATPFNFQWRKDGTNLAGATSQTLLLTGVGSANAGNYSVVVSNADGTATSTNALLTILFPPTITTPPQTTTVIQGNTLNLSVAVGGTAPFTYQWKLNGVNVAGATSATLSIPNVQTSQAGTYTVDVSNACGSVTSPGAVVTVGVPPTINGGGQPQSLTVCTGTNVTFSVAASGTAPLSYQWLFNGAAIGGATSSSYVIPSVSTANAGNYTVQINNAHGSVTSSAATLTVLTPPSITVQPTGTTVLQGNTLNLSVSATGSATLVYQWRLNGAAIAGANSAFLSIPNIQAAQAGTYTVDISNACGSITSQGASVVVGIPPTVNGGGQPVSRTLCVGTNVTFSVAASGTAPLTYQWIFNGSAIGGATASSYTIPSISTANAGNYSVQINNAHGSVTSSAATLTVLTPPSITVQPTGTTVLQGNTLNLSVSATGSATLVYQWRLNGAAIAGANSAFLSIPNIQAAQAGTYTVDISNACGSITSQGASVVVGIPPTVNGGGQPVSRTLCVGTNVTFSVAASGTAPLSYQWSFNGVAINGATSSSYTIPIVNFLHDGVYTVQVSNAHGSVTSAGATLTVQLPPSITTQPQTTTVILGNTLNLSVANTGTAPFTYQWKLNGVPLAGQIASTLTIANIQANQAGTYTVDISNVCGTTTSAGAPVTVGIPPTISGHPQDQVVLAGTTATFTVTHGGDGPCTYQWLKNGLAIGGATNQTLAIVNAQDADEGNFSVVITCQFGTVTSNPASLTVNNPPSIITPPQSRSVLAGTTVVFNVTATGDPTLTYQWKKNGVNLAGQTGTSLTLSNVQDADEGNFTVMVMNPFGNVTSVAATLTVNNPPSIVGQPQDQDVIAGSAANFTVSVGGDGPCAFQWMKNGVNIPGATNQVLTILNSQESDEALYSVRVTCPFGTATSNPASLTVRQPPVVITNPLDQSVLAGSTATFNVVGGGDPTLTYQWFRNGLQIAGATNTILFIVNAQDADEGTYSAQVMNPYGTATSAGATLTVNNPPVINTHPQPRVVLQGTSASFSVIVSGDGPCTFQWLKNGALLANATNQTLTINNSQGSDEANYSVIITCPFGSVTSNPASLTVNEPPIIISNPVNRTVFAGTTTTFSVVAGGDPTITYQWSKNGVPIAGATSPTLVINSAQETDEGNYSATATNPFGSATSTAATLTVNTGPAIVGHPQPQTVLQGTPSSFTVTVSGDGPCTYQWLKNGVVIAGATNQIFAIASSQPLDEADYSVIVTCAFGSATSNPARLTVNEPPLILTPPANQTVIAGSTASFSVTATGDPTLIYQWFRNGITIAGATNTTHFVFNAQDADEGAFSVQVSNPFGQVISTNAFLVVNNPPTITGQPQPQEVIEGNTASFTVNVSADGACGFQWLRNGVIIAGATNQTLFIVNSQRAAHQANYAVVITCPFGSVTSQQAFLTVRKPPFIITNPANQSVLAGSSASFSVFAGGDPTITYQWKKNGINIAGATNTVLVVSNAQDADEGNYSAQATNPYGSVSSASATLTVNNPPVITGQPQSLTVLQGSPATFSVGVGGDGPCSFQWRKNNVDISGATNQTLTISNSQNSDEASYTVVITCPFGTVVSNPATLTVNEPPIIISNPVSLSRIAGNQAIFNVVAGGDPTITYQWFKNGISIAGATNQTLVLNNVQDADEGGYRASATNPFGSVSSSSATLTVNNPPVITGQPQPQSVIEGNPSSFTVAVSGDGPCTFQWRKNGVVLAGQTNQVLNYASSQLSDAGSYSVVVTCPFGTATSQPATLTVNRPPTIIVPPQSQSVIAGSVVTFNVVATGDPTLTYQWKKNGADIVGAVSTSLVLFNTQDADEGAYSVMVMNPYGSATSTIANLTVNNPPSITGHPQPQVVLQGTTATFTVAHGGDGPCSYQWLKNGSTIQGATSQTLTINNSQPADEANYSVVVTCPFGSATSNPASLTVNRPPFIITDPQATSAVVGTTASFSVTAGGDPVLRYQWKKNGVNIAGATQTTLLIVNVTTNDVANYSVMVTNDFGMAASANAPLTINRPPVITGQPQDREVIVGNSATFSVTVDADGPCTYQWRFNGVNIAGATSASYTVANAQVHQQGTYSVVITCPFGSATSREATLTVRTPPTITQHPASQTIVEGTTVILNSAATGDPTLFYQWKYQGTNLVGQTNTFLVLNNVQTNQTGTYFVTVTNLYGSATSSNAVLSVRRAPVITSQPQPQSVVVGQSSSFSVTVSADGPCTYQWRKDGVNIAGAVQSTYAIASSQLTDQGLYSVVITCPFGTVTSQNARLTVNEPPRITLHPVSQTVVEGTNVTFTGAAAGTPTLFYQWRKNGVNIPGANGTTLVLPSVTTNDFGQYSFVVTNAFGTATSTNATLDVRRKPAIVSQPQSLTVVAGSPASFSVTVSGDGPCTYQWRKNGVNIAGATAATYSIASAQHTDQASYSVVVTCPFGTVTSQNATLTVVDAPAIIFNPISEIVEVGTNAVISVLATGTETLTYQWYYQPTFGGVLSGTPVSGGNFATLVLRNVTTNLTGVYYCVVQNAYGSATSLHASITVVDPSDLNSGGGPVSGTQRTLITPTVTPGSGLITFQFGTVDGQAATAQAAASIVVQGSTDLSQWVNLPTTVSIVNGLFQVTFNDPATLTHRYYRIRYQ